MTVVLRPEIPPSRAPAISLVAGYSVATAIREMLDIDARVKWPNDVLIGGLKVSGILSEMSAEPDRVAEVVVGIGVNANTDMDSTPPDVRRSATSLRALGRPVDRNHLIASVLNHLEASYLELIASGLETLAPKITQACALLGQPVVLRNLTAADKDETCGVFQGIDQEGCALLRLPDGQTRAFAAGDLSLRSTG